MLVEDLIRAHTIPHGVSCPIVFLVIFDIPIHTLYLL